MLSFCCLSKNVKKIIETGCSPYYTTHYFMHIVVYSILLCTLLPPTTLSQNVILLTSDQIDVDFKGLQS